MMTEQVQPTTHQSRFRRGLLFTSSGSIAGIFFLFLETMIAVRILTTGSYGIYVLLIALVNFLVVIVDLGCKTAVTQIIASSDREQQAILVSSSLLFRVFVIIAISAVIWLSSGTLLMLDSSPGVLLYLGYVPLMLAGPSLDELLTGMLQGFHAYHHLGIAQIGRGVLRLCLSIILLSVFQLGVLALIYSWIISFVVSIVYQYVVLPTPKRLVFNRQLLIDMLRFGFPLQMTRFLWLVFRRIDVLLLGTLAGSASAAFYEVAARIPDALQRLSESFIAVYFPTMSSLLASGKREEASWTLNHSLRLLSFVAALGSLIAFLFSRRIVELLFSEKYLDSSPAFALLMIAFHMTLIVNLMGYTLTSAGYPGRSFVQNLARSILNVLGDVLWIPTAGFLGPVYATLAAVYLANPLGIWLLRRSEVAIAIAPYTKQTLILLLCTGLGWWLGPAGFFYKLGIIGLFVGLNLALGTVSHRDISLIVPVELLQRPALPQESLPDGN